MSEVSYVYQIKCVKTCIILSCTFLIGYAREKPIGIIREFWQSDALSFAGQNWDSAVANPHAPAGVKALHTLTQRPSSLTETMSALRSLSKSILTTVPRVSRQTARPALARAYHEKVISHYEQPRNVSQ